MLAAREQIPEIIRCHRAQTYNTAASCRPLRNREEAIRFVNRRGFIFFWPNKEYDFPSLWNAVAGNRPVAEQHDDPAHITWRWKDSLLGKKRWYYAKVIRQRSTIISLELLPYFYALSPNFGSPEQDYLLSYEYGELTVEEKNVFEALLRNGMMDAITLRETAGLASAENHPRFSRALSLLQRDFRILPVGVSERGAWHYSFMYDLTHRHFPELVADAQPILDSYARQKILNSYMLSMGGATFQQISKLFQWSDKSIKHAMGDLIMNGVVSANSLSDHKEQEWFTIRNLSK